MVTSGDLCNDKDEKLFIFSFPICVSDSNEVELPAVGEALRVSNILLKDSSFSGEKMNGHFSVKIDCPSSIK